MEWIKITDRLPKKEDYYLIWDGEYLDYARYDVERNQWHDEEITIYEDVTHWMPLPEPPK